MPVDLDERPGGVLALREAGADQLGVGDAITATVVQPEGPDGRVVLSLRRSRSRRQWSEMEELQRSGKIIDAPVIDANRGGVVLDVGLRGFIPLSQLGSIGAIDTNQAGVPDHVCALVGRSLRVRVIEVDPKRDRLILSEKAATQQLRRERKAQGAAAQRSHGHRDRPRPGLSMKRLADDPKDRFMRDVQVGQTLAATVTRVMPYGAFAKVADGVEGLVHVSELAGHRVADPSAVVRVGDVVPVKVVSVDTERRCLSLSARLADRSS